jgi:hypothetical protein
MFNELSAVAGGICALQKYRLRFGEIRLFEASN